MEERVVSEREFINYFKGLGGYCTYHDAFQTVQNLLQILSSSFGIDAQQLVSLLPESVRIVLNKGAAEQPLSSQFTANFPSREIFEKALLTLFGTLKEKCASRAAQWRALLPAELKELWDKSRTIDQLQEAGQCL